MTEKTNTFEELEQQKKPVTEQKQEPAQASGEINLDDFSDTAVGEKTTYVRPELDGTQDVIDKFQVFAVNTEDEPQESQSGKSKYWKVSMILSYGSKNPDGVQNREYISGARCFVDRNGKPSDTNFWYEGGETQSIYLWELVATQLGKKPEEMSPREFVVFLNSKPKVKIIGQQTKNYNAPAGSPKFITKNMIGEFL